MGKVMGFTASIVLLAAVAACGDDDGEAETTESPAASDVDGEIVVFAAASLTEAFDKVGQAFEAANPDASVTFNYAGSSTLAEQINQGAPADVFASADERNMDLVVDEGGAAGDPVEFVTNSLMVAVEPGNPLDIAGAADLADPSLTVVLCDPAVPCGGFAIELFDKAGVDVEAKSLEEDVKAVLTKVSLGEADAGIVYETDVLGADGDVDGIDIPAADNVVAHYPIAPLAEAPNEVAADAFVAFVTGDDGQAILQEYGFGAP